MTALLLIALAAPAHAAEVLETSNDTFQSIGVDLGLYVQPRFTFSPEDTAAGSPGEVGFALRRTRLSTKATFLTVQDEAAVDGWSGLSLETGMAVEFVTEPRLYDAYADLRLAHPLQLKVGQFKAPTTRAQLVSGSRLVFQDDAGLVDLAPKREIGAMLHGFVGHHHLDWAAGVFNGEGTNRLENVNRQFLYAARIEVSPLGANKSPEDVLRPDWRLKKGDVAVGSYNPDTTFTLAGHGFRNTVGAEGEQEGKWGVGGDAFFHWRWVNLTGAYLTGAVQWEDAAVADSTFWGWYGQLVLFPPAVPWAEEHLALVSRVEQFDELVPAEGFTVPLTGATDPAQEQRNLTFGVQYFVGKPGFKNLHDAKVQVAYTVRQELEDSSYDNDELLVSSQFAF